MPSYLQDLPKRWCEKAGCLSLARVELFNDRNASCGFFCNRCGDRELLKRLRVENDD